MSSSLLKRTKKSFQKRTVKLISNRNMKYSHASTFKDIMAHRVSFRSALKSERVLESNFDKMDLMNDNLMAISNLKDEKLAV